MNYILSIRKEAELDINNDFEYYQEKRAGLGHDFLLCVEEALEKLQRNPLAYREIYKGLRRVPIQRFPYRIFYVVQNHNVIITAVFHARKDPKSWSLRR